MDVKTPCARVAGVERLARGNKPGGSGVHSRNSRDGCKEVLFHATSERNGGCGAGSVLRICCRAVAQVGGPAFERKVLAQAVSIRKQRWTPGAARDGKFELLHRSTRRGNGIPARPRPRVHGPAATDRKSTRLNSSHT